MDNITKNVFQAYQEVQEKALSAKQKKLDKDKDGDIDGDDFASMRNDKKRQQSENSDCPKCNAKGCSHCEDKGVSEEAPADPIKKAPARKGDKSNSDVKEDVEQVDEGPLSKAADDRLGREFGSRIRVPKTSAAKKYLRKKQADKNAEITKNDPKTAKQGYGRSIVDVQKALSKAKKKGMDTEKLKKGLNWRHRNSAQNSKLPSDKK